MCEPQANELSCNFPERKGFINDYCNLLNADEFKNLELIATNYFAQTGNQIVVIIEDSNKPHSRKFHCPDALLDKWQLDPKTFKDVAIVISKKRRYVAFNYGITSDQWLTVEDRRIILREKILPSFNRKHFAEGLRRGMAYIIEHRKTSGTAK